MSKKNINHTCDKSVRRRTVLKSAALGLTSLALPFGNADAGVWESFFQKHFHQMNKDELQTVIARMESEYKEEYGKDFNIKSTKPIDGVKFGYGLDLSRCIGCRRCVYACVEENNQSRDPQIHWISVLELKKGER